MSYQKSSPLTSIAVTILCGAAILIFGVILFEMTRTLMGG